MLGNLWPHFLRSVTAVRARVLAALCPVEGNEVAGCAAGPSSPGAVGADAAGADAPRQHEELMIVLLNTVLLTRDSRAAAARLGHADALVARLTRALPSAHAARGLKRLLEDSESFAFGARCRRSSTPSCARGAH